MRYWQSSLLLACALASTAARADRVAVFVGQTINVREEDALAFASVCGHAWAKASKSELIPLSKGQAALKQNPEVVAAASSVGAAEYLSLELIGLPGEDGNSSILVSTVRGNAAGAILHRGEISIASLHDAVSACDRLVQASLNGVSTEATRNRHNVTTAESRAESSPVRLKAAKVFGFKLGFGEPVGEGASYNPIGAIQFNMLFDREHYFLELGGGALIPAPMPSSSAISYGGVTGELGASYYLSDSDNAPYLGAGITPRIVFSGSFINVAPYVQLGMMLWRQFSPRIYINVRVAQNALPVTSVGGTALGPPAGARFPTELTAQVGMGF